ncbi:MAG: DUF72 domain-containing protein [Deltaproteobacteria bacterium]|nr:DUF72 domain-containing protein [Deltaproteobacteria bacterium]
MYNADPSEIEKFFFRDIHPRVHMGTASDRYAGWVGQIYTKGKYNVSSRTHKVGGQSFVEETLPVESVVEYFQHFSVLEIDFTFYMPLLSKDLKPTSNYKILQSYNKYLKNGDRIILKVPQVIFAQKIWQKGKQVENPNYLNAEMFTNQFYDPANAILGDRLIGFIFEQEYQRKADRVSPNRYVEDLDRFIGSLPKDNRYHIETRTDYYHVSSYFEMLDRHGVGHVLSHWTWLPPLRKQFIKTGQQFYNSGKHCIIRLLTPLRKNFNESYAQAHPFDNIIPGMMNQDMIVETVEIVKTGISNGFDVNVIVNNRAGGNAPLIAREIAGHFI